jgi:O-antigen/teichoic acid export membrane protein/CelD/BcsL family acetyltransferase involved in cellulose biosynthesis
VAQRAAGSAFLIRVFNAGLGFLIQILFARWMGEYEYGIYAYAWVWVLLLGGISTLGIASTTQRFVPEYTERGDLDGLRGYLVGAPLLVVGLALCMTLAGFLLLGLFGSPSSEVPVILLAAALVCLPAYALSDVQDAIARSYNWINLALMPVYVFRPIIILVLVAILVLAGMPANATWVIGASILAIILSSFGQTATLVARLKGTVTAGPRRYAPSHWLKLALPVFMIDGFYLSLTYTDVLILESFASPEEVAIYYAATKIMGLGALIYFAVSAATAHRFAEYATVGDTGKLKVFLRDAVRWTFWPTLAVVLGLVVVGKPFLWLFGEAFTQGYVLLPILGIGLLARASVGPCERLLSMLGEQNRTAAVYGGVFAGNLVLNLILVPNFGMVGSAVATSLALMLESGLLFWLARRRLGLHSFVLGGERPTVNAVPAASDLRVEECDARQMEGHLEAWRDLVVRAVEPNGFYDPDFALAAARHLPGAQGVRFVLVWSGEQLEALVPTLSARRRYILPFPLTSVWPAYAPLSTPLLDRDRGAEAFRAVLDHMTASGARACLIPRLSDAGAAAALMQSALTASGRRMHRLEPHGRALLTIGGDPVDRIKDLVTAKKAKEFARLRRRLADMGEISIDTASDRHGVMDALERFLALEASGWKGRRGTALANDPGRLAFVREGFAALALRGRAEVVMMRVGELDMAGGLILRQSGRAFYFKTTYNEEAARYSPGVLLSLALTGIFLADPRLVDVDSVADADHPMIDHLWRDRLPVADWLVELRPVDPVFDLARGLELAWRAARRLAHRLRHRAK